MADPPRKQPPPLPGARVFPYPFRDLTEDALPHPDPMPDTVRTRRDEMPPAALSLDELEVLREEPPLTRGEANSLRQELILLREALPTLPGKTVPPVSIRTRSRTALVGLLGTTATAGVLALLTLAAGVAAKLWPQYADLILVIAQALGGGQ